LTLYFKQVINFPCATGTVVWFAITLDRSASFSGASESSCSLLASSSINQSVVDLGGGHVSWCDDEALSTAATTTAQGNGSELIMGRKKIQITQIADERNRQVIRLTGVGHLFAKGNIQLSHSTTLPIVDT